MFTRLGAIWRAMGKWRPSSPESSVHAARFSLHRRSRAAKCRYSTTASCAASGGEVVTHEMLSANDAARMLKAWLYGHTHTPGRRHVGDIEYVTQPRGFPNERRTRKLPAYQAARVTVTSR